MNSMRNIRIAKLTLNVGAGKDQGALAKGVKLLKNITGIEPVKTKTHKRIPGWGLRPGLPIGCKITLRKNTKELIKRMLDAKNNQLKPSSFDENGNIAFGIPEYIDIPGIEYDPEIGITGFEACITLERAGFRIKRRKIQNKHIHKNHQITKEEAIEFAKKEFGTKVGSDDN